MRIIKQSSNQKCMTQPTLTNLHSNKYSQEFHFYPFAVKLNRCVGSFNDLPNKVFISNKTRFKCNDKCNSNQWWNNNECCIEYKNVIYVKRIL